MSGHAIEYANLNPVLIITPQGQLKLAEGASTDQATRALFEILEANFSSEIARRKTRTEKLEAALRRIATRQAGTLAGPTLEECISIAQAALEGE